MLWNILIGVAGVLILLLVVAAARRSAYHVERKLEVAAPTDLVFGVLNDLHQFTGVLVLFGTPWDRLDPGMQGSFEGPAAGVGQRYAWSGHKAGKGEMTLEESVPGQRVRIKLEFVKPLKSTASCTLRLADTPAGSCVTWSMDGNHNFLGKALGMFMDLERMLGADLEHGLAQLKTIAERTQHAVA